MTLDQKPVSLQLRQHNNTHSTTPMPSAVQIKGGNQPMFPGGPYANILPLLLAYQMGNFGLLQPPQLPQLPQPSEQHRHSKDSTQSETTVSDPDIITWFSSLDQHLQRREKYGLTFAPYGPILWQKGFFMCLSSYLITLSLQMYRSGLMLR